MVSQFVFQNPSHVLVAQILVSEEYWVFVLVSQQPIFVSLDTPFDMYPQPTVPDDQLILCASILRAIVIHSLLVIRWYHTPIDWQAAMASDCVIFAIGNFHRVDTGIFHATYAMVFQSV